MVGKLCPILSTHTANAMSSQGAGGILRRELVTALAVCFQSSSRSIVSLLEPRGPAAVIRRVRTIVVDAIKRVVRRRTRAHIGEKGFETCHPAIAHRNAAASVPMPLRV